MLKNNPDAIISVVFATSNNIPADGTSTASVTAQVTDSAGAGLSGQSVVFTATAGALIGSPVITDTSGLATTTLTSTTAGISSVTASVNSSTGHVDITFTEAAHSPVISSLISDKDSITNDGEDKATLVATVTDSKTSEPLSGVTVHWSSSQGTVTPASSVSNASGLAVAALADTGDTGLATVTASLDNGSTTTTSVTINQTYVSGSENFEKISFGDYPFPLPAEMVIELNSGLTMTVIESGDTLGFTKLPYPETEQMALCIGQVTPSVVRFDINGVARNLKWEWIGEGNVYPLVMKLYNNKNELVGQRQTNVGHYYAEHIIIEDGYSYFIVSMEAYHYVGCLDNIEWSE
ncbi:Ig-like domain-containing protein [Kluyvera intermedia]|uniref:Ig-like domain-containing protein n=1 Tax=Kluyvera intermedia TaxID=61648 RepID=UPI003525F4DC